MISTMLTLKVLADEHGWGLLECVQSWLFFHRVRPVGNFADFIAWMYQPDFERAGSGA